MVNDCFVLTLQILGNQLIYFMVNSTDSPRKIISYISETIIKL